MKPLKVIVRDCLTGKPTIATLKEDDYFWGGYKVEYGNTISSINITDMIHIQQISGESLDKVADTFGVKRKKFLFIFKESDRRLKKRIKNLVLTK